MFSFNDLNDMFETYKVTFEIYLEDNLVEQQTMQAPKEFLMANFIQTVNQISEDVRPIKIKMSRPEIIWDNFENKQKVITNNIIFSNNAMVDWERE